MENTLKEIRRLINQPRRQYNLIKNLPSWHQLCASLDVIEDAKCAIDSYAAAKSETSTDRWYLLVYGVLQALFLQQDATRYLCEALAIPTELGDYPELISIRAVRNESIGHPSKKEGKKGSHSYHHIVRTSLSLNGFELHTFHQDGRFARKNVSIKDCIADQDKYLKEILAKVVTALRHEERQHKERFMGKKLVDCFPKDVRYWIGKIYEAANLDDSARNTMAGTSVKVIEDAMTAFTDALAERGIELDTYDPVKYESRYANYALAKLCEHFTCLKRGEPRVMTQMDVNVYCESLERHVLELMKVARSIDDDYADLTDD